MHFVLFDNGCCLSPPHSYTMTVDENGEYGRVECRPTTGYNVGAKNMTLFLEDRGASAVDETYHLVNYDNKFQPYHLVVHAGMSPPPPLR